MPISLPAHPVCCSVAPFRLRRAELCSLSLDASGPHRMIGGASVVGAAIVYRIRDDPLRAAVMVTFRSDTCDKCKNASPVSYRGDPEEAW
jgi:hypothetical protein